MPPNAAPTPMPACAPVERLLALVVWRAAPVGGRVVEAEVAMTEARRGLAEAEVELVVVDEDGEELVTNRATSCCWYWIVTAGTHIVIGPETEVIFVAEALDRAFSVVEVLPV